jgi:2-polyprenyl-3-methyl-5-hydroxy-6-metoxy-1,4-benzoquinol methylase
MVDSHARDLHRWVLNLYSASWGARVYTWLKLLILPLREATEHLPRRGLILDMGCGFGYVANYLSLDAPERVVIANDPDVSRIEAARRTVGGRPNIEFHAIDSRELARADFDGVNVTDVLHHVPYDQQQALIDDVYRKLKPGGTLVIRETDRRPALRYYLFNVALETLLYLGQEKTRFRPRRQWAEMLERAGFRIEQASVNAWWFPYTTCSFVCRKPLDA